ncbi:WD40-repeat-containing domain protein [Radiomyces spectabilis]|uniref:WD40-repeat-containing domain protein n=1 Tax=Radiomyces spectabilis TaxID=64574 RepID=UPI00221E63F6|nr:WD40-repeat-containing domain protein [Radiomyces spectabilis]KAI8374553.1 WD40-repeat-containing domain protein [Radiomyces spectabilis]
MQETANAQYEIADPPKDGISSLAFCPVDSRYLIASSWDQTARIYDIESNQTKAQFDHESAVLSACFGNDSQQAFSGSVDKKVRLLDVETVTTKVLGQHDEAVRSVRWSSNTNNLYTGSWDKTLCVWDPRNDTPLVSKHDLPQKVFDMDLQDNTLILAMANRQIYVYDIRNMNEPQQTRESTLRYMLRSIRLMPNGEGYACSSVEGRVALEFFDQSPEVQAKKYAFKSHRQTINETEIVYPVNALAYHPIHGTFASGGSDCVVSIWDGVHRKRIRQFPRYPDEISSLAFSPDGKVLAVASSYTFDEGERDHSPDAIFIRPLGDNDCKPRSATVNGN